MPRIFRRRRDPALTPAQREARIAELRVHRRARMKVLARRSAFTTVGLILLLLVVVWWLLTTLGGRDFLLAQIVARLPSGAELTWARAEGPVSGPMTLHDVHFSMSRQRDPDCEPTQTTSCASGHIVFDAARVTLDPAIWPLLGRTLRLDALQIEDAVLDLPESDAPFQLPSWPDVLPKITPPLALHADDVRIHDFSVTREGAPLIDISQLRGGIVAEPGALHLEHLRIDSDRGRFTVHGDYVPEDDYRADLTATAVLPAAPGRTPARLGLVARGDLAQMQVALAGNAPGPIRATLVLRGDGKDDDSDRTRWQLRANAEALDPGLLTDPGAPPSDTPLSLQLRADGIGGLATVSGVVQQGEFEAKLLPSQLQVNDQVLQLDPLRVELLGGSVLVRGTADFSDPENTTFGLSGNVRGLTWGGAIPAATSSAQAITTDAEFDLAGTVQAWTLAGKATLTRAGEQATLALDGRGNSERMQLQSLTVRMPTGTLDANGVITWAPVLGWDIDARLAGFDPGYFFAGWEGAVNGDIQSSGKTRNDGGLEVTVAVSDLGGQLRGRPLDGSGNFAMHGSAVAGGTAVYEGEIALSLGGSRIDAEGRIGERVDVDARFSPLQLADLLPDASGSLRGSVQVSGPRNAPDISADLDGNDIRHGDYSATSLSINGELPWSGRTSSGAMGALSLHARDLVAGIALDRLDIDARGAVENLQLDAHAQGEIGTMDLATRFEKRGNRWVGTIATLRLDPQLGASWRLQQAASFSWAGSHANRTTLDDFCLASSAGGVLCASADWPRRGIAITGKGLPLSLVTAYLPESGDGRSWQLHGELAIDAQLRPQGSGWIGQARIASTAGGLKFSERAKSDLFAYDDLLLTADFQPRAVELTLGATLNDDGRIDAHVNTGWDASAPLAGGITLTTDELTWLELLSPDIVAPTGQLDGRVTLGGTRAEPRIGGQARLTNFSTEIPSLAITLRDGNVRLLAQADGTARISGSVRSSASDGSGNVGVLNIDGTLGWQGDAPLVLHLKGERVLVSDTLDLHAVASPDITVQVVAGKPIEVTGSVTIPEATIDLERLDGGVSVSPDVVVLDPVDPQDNGMATGLVLDLTLVLGEDVDLHGFGLDASLDGRLRVRSQPGREMTASGNLQIDGSYEAYGQQLEITSGQLSWSNGPVADPFIALRAQRKIGDVTAGVVVSGRASAPHARVWSDPASSQSDALAWLTLGRPLSSLSGSERGQVSAASTALTAGGSLLAGKLGAKLGLDDAGVMQSRALGGSVLGIGKQLSPRLYVGYGVSLLGTGQVLILKYLLDHGFDIEIESSTVENRALLNWRKEK